MVSVTQVVGILFVCVRLSFKGYIPVGIPFHKEPYDPFQHVPEVERYI